MKVAVTEELLDRVGALVSSTRQLMLASATTDADPEDVARAEALVAEATTILNRRSRNHGLRRHLDRAAIARTRDGEPWQVFGHNPLGIPLVITVDGRRATASVEASALLEGPPRLLHGGFSAAMMDALLSTLVQVQDMRAVTVRLDVSFQRPVPLDKPLSLVGEITSVDGRKIVAEGRVEYDGEVAVRAEALFIEVAGEPD